MIGNWAHPATAENVNVEAMCGLVAIMAMIGDQSAAAFLQAELPSGQAPASVRERFERPRELIIMQCCMRLLALQDTGKDYSNELPHLSPMPSVEHRVGHSRMEEFRRPSGLQSCFLQGLQIAGDKRFVGKVAKFILCHPEAIVWSPHE